MARFDVFELNGGNVPYVLDVQANILSQLNTRVVVPLLPYSRSSTEAAERLNPVITIENEKFILMTADIGTVKLNSIGAFKTSIEKDHRQEVTEALDFLFQGF